MKLLEATKGVTFSFFEGLLTLRRDLILCTISSLGRNAYEEKIKKSGRGQGPVNGVEGNFFKH